MKHDMQYFKPDSTHTDNFISDSIKSTCIVFQKSGFLCIRLDYTTCTKYKSILMNFISSLSLCSLLACHMMPNCTFYAFTGDCLLVVRPSVRPW